MRSGIARDAMDLAVRPQDDLYGYVNGAWIAATPMPADRGRYGAFDMLRERSEEDMRALLEEGAAAARSGARDLPGALYASFVDEDRADELGLAPVAGMLADIDAAPDARALFALLGGLGREGVGGAVHLFVNTDDRDPDAYVAFVNQSGLGLPDESYYRLEQYAPLRTAYVEHLARLFALAGTEPDAARTDAEAVMALETRLAAGHWDVVACRDAVKTYTKVDAAGLAALGPAIPWEDWRVAAGAPATALDPVVVRQPSYLSVLSYALAEVDLPTWRAWARTRVLHAYAGLLHAPLVAEHFDFYGRTLSGTPEQRARWKRAVGLVDQMVGEEAGKAYVARYFPSAAKDRMAQLVANLVEAYRRDISDLTWMSPQTREKALAKLDAFTPKIGYPDRWRDYTGLEFDAADLVGNVRRASAFETDRDWRKLGSPVDRDEWFMSPQTVNAYYNPGMNEIVFPAAILQPPFFDVEADDAVNYGAIGSVIGHEIGHGFDDQGSRYDGRGELVDWWTAADREAFDALSQRLITQYDAFHPRALPDEHVNGALTVGENIGDLGGVTIAHLAYRLSLGDGDPETIDGLTGDQRFFAGWAQIWRMIARPEEARRLLAIDPHSPGEFRANIVRNLTEFYDAFGVGEGDALWLPEDQRVRIW